MTSQRTLTIRILGASVPSIIVLTLLTVLAAPAMAQNPVPFVDQPLVPDAAAPGGAAFTLTVNGAGFVASSTVNWNGSPLATTFVSSTQLTAAVPSSDIATASTATVTIVSPSPGGGVSNTLYFPINTPSASIAFSTTDYTVGSYPLFAATADLRGNGNLDLAVANDGGSVSVMLGNGNGTFQAQVEYAAGSFPQAPIIGDYNGDGKLDLAVPAQGNSAVDILLGNGNGTFQPAVSYPGGCAEAYGITADFNGDGNLDVLTVNQCGTVSILLGNGDGTFQAPVNYAVGSVPTGAATGDLNRDGKLDIAVSNWGSDTVSVLLGNGDGTFQSAVDYPTGDNPGGVNIADINGDGILDLLVPNQESSNVSVLLGKGDGTFAAQVEYPVASGAVRAEVGDFNQDGKLDLAVVTYEPSLDLLLGNGDGTFQPALSFPTAGNPWNVVVADFNQDGRLDAAVSGADVNAIAVMLQTSAVGTTPTSTTLISSLNPSVYGQSVTFTSAVSSAGGTPTGTVIFYDGSTSVGSATLSSGKAAISVSSLAADTHSITAAYQGSATFAASTSTPLSQIVNLATTTISLTSSQNPAGTNQTVSFTATIASQYGSVATGTATFYSGSQTLGTASLLSNRATLGASFTTAGTYSISAKYNGDANNLGSTSPVLSEVINPAITSTTTTLTSSPNPSLVGQSVAFTAAVTSAAGSPPNGEMVTFYNGSSVLGTATLSAGIATLITSSLPLGTFTITATYPGDANFSASTSPGLRQVVNAATKYATSTALASSPNPSIKGQLITFTATVTSTGGTPPNGETVTFYNGLGVLGTATLTGGIASLTKSSLGSGIHSISAAYLGDANFTASTSPVLEQEVDTTSQSPTTTALASSLNPSIYGQTVTWTATVTTSGKTTPTGKVNFNWGSDSIGSATLNSSGVATLTKSNLSADPYPLFAVYTGDTNNGPSASAILNQTVTQTTSAATLTSSLNPSTQGQSVTFTATITSPTTTPTGPVTFSTGKTTLGTVELSKGKATFTTSTLAVGSDTVTVTYPWNSDISGSSASVLQTVTGSTGTTAATLTWAANPPVNETFTATITSTKSVPTGTVTFTVGNTVLGTSQLSNGIATLTTSTLSVGSNTVTATYSGDANNSPTSAWATQTFVMPYNATLYLQQEGGSAGATTEFGTGTSSSNFVEYYSGLPNDPNPTGQVLVGSFNAGTIVNFGMYTVYGSQTGWAFSTGTDQASLVSFADLNNTLGLNHSITQQTSSTTWVLWLDDAVSYLYDDDNNDVIMEIILVPNQGQELRGRQSSRQVRNVR
jgi:hypothetical protein